jgi:hypothetical protein
MMGFRFRRSVKILPGVRLTLSRSGVSTSVGGRGAWLTFGRRGTRATVGLPGSGISYSTTIPAARQTAVNRPGATQPATHHEPSTKGSALRGWAWIAAIAVFATLLAWSLFRG